MPEFEKKPKARATNLERWTILLMVAMTGWFYLWTIDPEGKEQAFSRKGGGYYNLLARGFMKGQLSLDQPADPFLATMANPYDSVARGGRGLHDASYFRGRYYLYFGVTPVIVMFAPVRLLTGWFLEENFACLVFAFMGFLVSVVALRKIRARWFPEAPAWVSVAGTLALGLATMVPALLRRPSIWEVPISCAYFFFMLTLWLVLRALDGLRPRLWLAAASLAMGLCVGARPVYLFGSIVLVAPLVVLAGDAPGAFWRRRQWWGAVACALGPIAAVGAGLAAYNVLRFGNPLEFGWTYQMAGDDNSAGKLFSVGLVTFNLRLYLLSAAGLSPYFPFVTVIAPPPVPVGQLGMENPYGLLPNLPWVGLALGAVWLAIAPRVAQGARTLRLFCQATVVSVGATFLTVCSFRGAAGRYLVDFAPGFVLLGGVGALWLTTCGARWWRWIASAAMLLLLGWSTAFGVLVSLQHNDLLRAEHPATYQRIAHAFNRAAQWIAPVPSNEVGAIELRLVFPRGATGQVEPLVVTGREFRSDYVFVHYLADDTVRFGFEHTSVSGASGLPMKIVPGAIHTIRVTMGSLYPPLAHPYFDAMDAREARSRTQTLRVWLDGRVALQRTMECYDATEFTPSIGTARGRPGFKRDFSGRLVDWKRMPETSPEPVALQTGPLRLRVKLPPFTGRHSEPLLSTGETGRGDLLYVTYEDASHVTFGHDHWGLGGGRSAAIEIDPGAEHVIELSCPPLLGSASPAGLWVRLDGREVFATQEAFHPCRPDTVSVGVNEIKASTSDMFFSGEVLSIERVQP